MRRVYTNSRRFKVLYLSAGTWRSIAAGELKIINLPENYQVRAGLFEASTETWVIYLWAPEFPVIEGDSIPEFIPEFDPDKGVL